MHSDLNIKPVKKEKLLGEDVNIAELLDEDSLTTIGAEVVSSYEVDLESRAEWEDNNREAMKLALQVKENKMHPWPNAANVKYPLLTTAALQFASRAYPALIPSTKVVKGRVVGYDPDGTKLDRAERIGRHMSYQLIEQMDEWEEEMDKLCLALPIVGCVFKKTYFNPVLNRNVSEIVFPNDLVINYYTKSMEKAERITHILDFTDNDIYERKAAGLYLDVDIEKPSPEGEEADEDRGLLPPTVDDDTIPYCILEQHTLIDLDGDGYKEPYIVTVDSESEKVLRITRRYGQGDIEYSGNGNEYIRINPVQYFTKYGFIPSPDGSIYDLGFGVLLGPLNDTVNTLINQLLDAGTLSNLQGGFISKGVRIKGGEKPFQPGEWKTANAFGDDLRKGIVPLPVREPSNVLFTLLNTIVTSGERLSSITEMMTGEIPGQNTKATVAMAAIEQGMKVFNAIYKRIYRSMKKEFRKLYELNKIHITDQEYFMILDAPQQPGQQNIGQVSQTDYQADDTDIIPYADPSIATEEQKLAKLNALGEVMALGNINPQEYTRRFLEATEQPNIEALMQMPPPQPDPEIQFEQQKFQDESAREWKKLEIEAALATSKMTKEEVEAIVALVAQKSVNTKVVVDAIQKENELENQRNANRGNTAGQGGLEKSSNN